LVRLLDESIFFRANRQFIINIKACHYFTNEENGKLALQLIPTHKEEVVISQKELQLLKNGLVNSFNIISDSIFSVSIVFFTPS
jgi:DNA-binding LytR/AlgR family response regulator